MVFLFLKIIYFSENGIIAGIAEFAIHFWIIIVKEFFRIILRSC